MRTYNHLPPFKYSPLDEARQEIRLITLCAPSQQRDSDVVECSIKTVSLNANVDYLAISYVWGAPSPTHKLIINGKDPQILDIGTNLNEALQKFRNIEGLRDSCLWIDAICINQKDAVEKSWQVASMKSIFEQADEVVAWLGPAIDMDEKAFDMLENLQNRLVEAGEDVTEERFYEFADVLAKDDGSGGKAIQHIIDKPWFQRIWIQQEFLAAREVQFMCGGYFCRWEALFVASSTIKAILRVARAKSVGQVIAFEDLDAEEFGLHTASSGTDMFRMRCDFQGNNDIYSLWDLLIFAKAGEIRSSDPRDAIFALLGLASDASTLGIQADYKLTPQVCFIRTSRALLRQGHLRLLWLSSQPKSLMDLPSWVPDWSGEWDLSSFILAYCRRDLRRDLPGSDDGTFTAGCYSEPSLTFKTVNSQELLAIRGSTYDRIQNTSAVLGNWKHHNPFAYLRAAFELINKMATDSTSPFNLDPQVVVRTLLLDTETKYDGQNLLTRLDDTNNSSRLRPEILTKLTDYVVNDQGPPNADLEILYSFLVTKISVLQNRRIFITSNGSLGIGSAGIKPGDIVVVLHGAEVPFILRKDCIPCEVYNLMSEAYVHGIMDGELIEGKPEAREFQIF